MATPELFSFIFGLLKQTPFFSKINVKNDYPLSGAGIWTHNFLNPSHLP